MSYSIESLNSEYDGVQLQKAQQEQILQMQQAKEAKTQNDGTKVEDSSAVSAAQSKTDTIEISAEGQRALEQIKAAKASHAPTANTAKTDSTQTSTSDAVSASDEADSSISNLLNTDDDSVSTSDLYTMTENQLQTLVSKGTITRKEMLEELQRRSEAASSASASVTESEQTDG